ncbi:MAG: alpha/beta hydrolase [Clostridium cadaveris]|uniref:alpha/beta hydrolase n=1 Tax=Clostridium cadaveris TaxID=1529 RepID=UPI002A8F070A|nr:alpha/beta hydrolase [Clostridium cadaveris]
MKKKKILKISIISFIMMVFITLGFVGNYFYNLALNPYTSKEAIFGTEEEAEATSGQLKQEDKDWLLEKSNYSDEYIISVDGLNLHSYKIINKNKTDKWAIVVHGYTSEGVRMSSYAKRYYDMGYNVLIPDLRSHGISEGDYIGMGWDDRLDIIEWAKVLIKENSNSEIVLHGISMGAATVMMVSGEELPNNIKSIVADCGYTSAWNQFAYQLDDLFGLPAFPFLHSAAVMAKIRAGFNISDVSAIEQVKKSTTPILFIHGDEDKFVPYFMMDELYDAASCRKEKLTIKGAGHAKASQVNPETYWNTIEDFIK